jgi:pimeloyl-ACP methyl ester carboxylesterase
MFVSVGDVRLFVDVDGASLVPDGDTVRERPILVMLHGGPGFDHTPFKQPFFSPLKDVAQVVYYDHRGNGRSDRGSPERWTLDQWADDLRELCNVLGIEHPVVFGGSFGGFVALNYAVRHPEHPAGLILVSTSAHIHLDRSFAMFE